MKIESKVAHLSRHFFYKVIQASEITITNRKRPPKNAQKIPTADALDG